MQRVWGGRELERVYGRALPDAGKPYGESWEIVDRPDEQSVVDGGTFDGLTLHQLWTSHRADVFGTGLPDSERFPILIKILDARDDLSIQVHPPLHLAEQLGGEPKTEMWYIADRTPGAKLYVGLKAGVTRADLGRAVADGTAADLVHSISPSPGDSIFIPSGRLHAIGAGFLIHEIQQNSDTTYRVFDWNRMGLDGKPRDLHVEQSLASIDFDDFETAMDTPDGETLASCEFFRTDRLLVKAGDSIGNPVPGRFSILSIVEGVLHAASGEAFGKGSFLLLPKDADPLVAASPATVLRITIP
ncbi:MAG: mannose-6-phosphate isomerase [Verrucomicrobiaceae bacterium]|nr:MAG: mannose-6-phosphate isomerase [Verrucomicrobiaceae bacterium]